MNDTTTATNSGDGSALAINFLSSLAATSLGILAAREARASVRDQINFKRDAIAKAAATVDECCEEFPKFGTAEDVFGKKPEVEPYQEIEYAQQQYERVNVCEVEVENTDCHIENNPSNEQLSKIVSRQNYEIGLSRINSIVPDYDCASKATGKATCDLSKGVIPFQDALDIVSKGQELNNAIGTPGCNFMGTLHDFGVRRLSAIREGHGRHTQSMQVAASTIAGKERDMDVRETHIKPIEELQSRVNQSDADYRARYAAQLEQVRIDQYNESTGRAVAQLAHDVEAAVDPAKKGMSLQALQCCFFKANIESAAASINSPTISPSETTFGQLSKVLGEDSGQNLFRNAFDFFGNRQQITPNPNQTSILQATPVFDGVLGDK